ncbi:MAG: ABC transporter permease [Gemmatimonadaceae bacterium]|nr:ABC transporter permease [Gemmatimonadaceae bacterium]
MPVGIVVRAAYKRTAGLLRSLGKRAYFARDIARGLREPGTWAPETIRQMQRIGVESLPLAAIVAAFLGGVTAFQTRYQLFPGVQLSVVGLIVRQSIVLELGPLLTALVLTGRVGARMTAEIGTMRVTEQIDALETLSFDPVAYLALPRLLAALVMIPALTIIANATAILSAWATLVMATDVRTSDFLDGLRLAFTEFQVVYSLIKAVCFGGAIAFVCSYEGYVTEAGAEGVGRSTALAVVIASVSILVLDAIVAAVFAPFIQA